MKNRKWPYIVMSAVFTTLLLLPILGIPMWDFVQNPSNRYRANGASSTGHVIVIDEHYTVHTTSGSQSYLIYSKGPREDYEADASSNTITLSQTVDQLNWNGEYIITSAKATDGNESFMIINRKTVDSTGYSSKKEFERAKKEKGIKLSLKTKSAFDWY